jgi:hypothetical protein
MANFGIGRTSLEMPVLGLRTAAARIPVSREIAATAATAR